MHTYPIRLLAPILLELRIHKNYLCSNQDGWSTLSYVYWVFFLLFFLQVNNNLLLVGNANREINVRFLTFCSQQFIYSNILPAD